MPEENSFHKFKTFGGFMFIRIFSSVMIVTSAFTIIIGQTPEAKKEKEKAPNVFSWSFDGDGGYLGVQTQEVSKENFAKFGLREVQGVAVEKVMDNSPAAAAGIKAGDVILRFNGDEITSARKLTRMVSEVDPDHQVKLTISRGGSEQEITATVGKRPMPKFENGNFSFSMPEGMNKFDPEKFKGLDNLKDLPQFKEFKGEIPNVLITPGGDGQSFLWRSGEGRQIGIAVYPVTKQLGERFGVESGVMINNVRSDSPAAKAGLKAGDIVIEIDGKAVKNNLDLIKAINAKKEGDVQITIMRDRNRQTISVTPEASKGSGFVFQNDDDNGLLLSPTPPMPPMIARPAMPSTPVIAPAPMRLLRPSRVI